ncbi:MAG: hypothetical protein ACPGR5_07585 [Chitinophagales bacterium]
MAFDIQNTKIDLIQWLTTIEDSEILKVLKKFKDSELQSEWTSLSEEEKQSIEKGLQDIKQGKTTPHSEVRKIYEKYL